MSPHHKLFVSLEELELACRDLKDENLALKNQVSKLEASLKAVTTNSGDGSRDILSDNDRIAVRNQIQTYIKRIDDILEEPS